MRVIMRMLIEGKSQNGRIEWKNGMEVYRMEEQTAMDGPSGLPYIYHKHLFAEFNLKKIQSLS